MNSSDNETRRLHLRVAAKLMLAVAFLTVVFVVLSVVFSSDSSTRVMPTQAVDIAGMRAGEMKTLLWDGRPIVIYRRSDSDIAYLQQTDERLSDASSKKSKQPDWAKNPTRSRESQLFVSIGVGTDFSCPLKFVPASDKTFMGKPWAGGFVDECRGSRYDLAGRVYQSQYATKNLIVPNYTLRGDSVLLGG